MENEVWIPVAALVGVFALAIVIVWQIFATTRARAVLAREKSYRELAERATGVAERLEEALSDVRTRVQWMEKTMREVD